MKGQRWQELAFCVGVLGLAWIFRAHNIEALPPFNDESLHIRRAEQILVDRDISLTPFKLLVYYWIAFFRPDRLHAIFLGRTAVALFSLIGLAGTYATAKLLFGKWAARLALILAAFSPFMIFFDRLAFADPLTAALGILMVWMSVRLVREADRGRGRREAILAGILGTLIILAKTTGMPFLAMPIIAVLAFGKHPGTSPPNPLSKGGEGEQAVVESPRYRENVRRGIEWAIRKVRVYQPILWTAALAFGKRPGTSPPNPLSKGGEGEQGVVESPRYRENVRRGIEWAIRKVRAYQPILWTAALAFGVTMLPFVLHVLERTISGNYVMLVNNNLVLGLAEDRPPQELIVKNIGTLWKVNWILQSPALWILMLVAAIALFRQKAREAVYLLSAIVLPWAMSIFLGAELSTRYLTLGILPLFVLLVGGLQVIQQASFSQRPIFAKTVINGAIGLWCVAFCLPFIYRGWTDPTKLWLPERDRWEYFENFSAGYGLVDAARDIEQLPVSEPSGRINVIGLVGSCHQMRLYLHGAENEDDGAVWLNCPFFGWQGEFLMDVAAEIDQRLATESRVYLLAEPEIPYFDFSDLAPRWHWEEVQRYDRPFEGMEIILYRITPLENTPPS